MPALKETYVSRGLLQGPILKVVSHLSKSLDVYVSLTVLIFYQKRALRESNILMSNSSGFCGNWSSFRDLYFEYLFYRPKA